VGSRSFSFTILVTGLVALSQGRVVWAASQTYVGSMEFLSVLEPPSPPPPLANDSRDLLRPPLAGAKKSTKRTLSRKPSGTIESSSRMSRKRRFNRGLPRSTRGSLIDAGVIAPEAVNPGVASGSVPTIAPEISVREFTLPE
jgi:hypothetical protein